MGPLHLLLLVTTATSPVPADSCVAPGPPPHGWQKVGGSSFTFLLPQGYREVAARDPDLEVGGWNQGARRVVYEFGSWTNPLTEGPPEQGRMVCRTTIGGHPVKIVTGRTRDGRYLAAAHWDDLGRISVGPSGLTIIGTAPDSAGQQEVLQALWTVQIGG